jgi:hypothetical protein
MVPILSDFSKRCKNGFLLKSTSSSSTASSVENRNRKRGNRRVQVRKIQLHVEQRLPLNGRYISRFLLTGIILAKVIDSCQTHENNPGNRYNPDYIQDSKIMDKTSKD